MNIIRLKEWGISFLPCPVLTGILCLASAWPKKISFISFITPITTEDGKRTLVNFLFFHHLAVEIQ